MRNFKHYFLTATIWALATFTVVACGSKGGDGGSTAACTYVGGTCIVPSGSNFGGTPATPPYASSSNGTINSQSYFGSLNTALTGIDPTGVPYGYGLTMAPPYNSQYFYTQGYTTGSALVPWTYGVNNLQVAIAQASTTANADNSYTYYLDILSPAIVANAGSSSQIFASLNPYSTITVQGNLSTIYQSGTTTAIGYVMLINSTVCHNGNCQYAPVAELDINGTVANASMVYQLKYLSSPSQPTVATGTMRKGIDYL